LHDSELESLLSTVRDIFSQRVSLYSTRSNALHDPASRLPAELVGYILGFVDMIDLVTMTHVDNRWRTIATSTPSLWSKISLTVSTHPVAYYGAHVISGWTHCDKDHPRFESGADLDWFIVQLERVAEVPLDIEMLFNSHAESTLLDATARALATRAASVRTIHICTNPCTDWLALLGRLPVMSALQSLTLSVAGKGGPPICLSDFIAPDLGMWVFPALETLRLRGVLPPTTQRDFSPHPLKRLETDQALTGEELRRTLIAFPDLEELEMDIPRLISPLVMATQDIVVHKLQHFTITSLTEEPMSWAYAKDVITLLSGDDGFGAPQTNCPRITFPLSVDLHGSHLDSHDVFRTIRTTTHFSVDADGTTTAYDAHADIERCGYPSRGCVDMLDDFWGKLLWSQLNATYIKSAIIDFALWERAGHDWHAPNLRSLTLVVNSPNAALPNQYNLSLDDLNCPVGVALPLLNVVRFVKATNAESSIVRAANLCTALDFVDQIDTIILDGLSLSGDPQGLEAKTDSLVFV